MARRSPAQLSATAEPLSILLILRAFAAGASGPDRLANAIATGVPASNRRNRKCRTTLAIARRRWWPLLSHHLPGVNFAILPRRRRRKTVIARSPETVYGDGICSPVQATAPSSSRRQHELQRPRACDPRRRRAHARRLALRGDR